MRFSLRTVASLALVLFGAVAASHASPTAPEIDPSMAGANLVLVAGAIAIVRNRIKR